MFRVLGFGFLLRVFAFGVPFKGFWVPFRVWGFWALGLGLWVPVRVLGSFEGLGFS